VSITFDVFGIPAPQGSKTRMPNGAMVEGSSTTGRMKLRDWRSAVSSGAAVCAHEFGAFPGPVHVDVVFRFPVAKARARKIAATSTGMLPKTGKPDLDKLMRSTGDALVAGGLIARDELITEWSAVKCEVAEGVWTGASVTVWSVA
jgi:Holliday junction resolvase RusA-like endonuclease